MTKYRFFNESLGLELYAFFKPTVIERLDLECASGNSHGEKNLVRGLIDLLIGTSFVILYVLCLIAMAQQKFMKIICYRILFVIGLIDVFSMPANSLIPAQWSIYSALSIILAVNRCVDFIGPKLQDKLFGGWRLVIWLVPPILGGVYIYLTYHPLIFYPSVGSYVLHVHGALSDTIGPLPDPPEESFTPTLFILNNVGVSSIIFCLNLLMLFLMYRENRNMNANLNKAQRIISLQCFGICTSVLLTGILYVVIQFIEMPPLMYVITNMSWQLSNGSMAIFYMAVNRSMRREVLRLIFSVNLICAKSKKIDASATQT